MKWWIAVAVLGVILVVSSTGIWRDDSKQPEITCGSDVMGPGDVCEETRRGVTVDTYTYEEKFQEQKDGDSNFAKSGRWIQLGIGSALLVGGTVGIFLARRRRAQQKAKYSAMYAIPQDGGQPAPPAQAPHSQPHMPPPVQQHQPQQQYSPQQQAPQQYPPQQYQPQQHAPQQYPQQPYPPQQQQPHPQSYPDFGPRPGQ